MARTPLYGAWRKAMGATGVSFGPRALSRRHFLALAVAAAACRPLERAPPLAGGPRGVAIIGGGAAGLTCAYRLTQAGHRATLYEASGRFGGRMFTARNFNEDGQFCELGGELVDTNHTALQTLARELNVPIQRLAPEGDLGEDLFHINRHLYAQHDLLDANGQGAFRQAAERIALDQAALLTEDESWTARARELDQISLRAYLTSLSDVLPDWAVTVLDLAYLGEFGLPTDQQSALNLVDFIGTDLTTGFRMFGDSDELFRIEGGSSSLTDALHARLDAGITQKPRHALTQIAAIDNGVRLTFDTPDGAVSAEHDAVVIAIPFTKLRSVAGLDTLALGDAKMQAIRDLGYGDNAKIMVSTHTRPWKDAARDFPAPSNGTFYSDSGMQVVWETSRGQNGARGVLTNFLSGVQDDSQLARMAQGLQAISPPITDSLDTTKRALMFWQTQPFALGSYASARVGQYTTLLEETATPAQDGRIQFAGEHTSADFLGYMNGAVESGERVAAALLASS